MSAIPSPVLTVLELFSSELTDVRFGNVDAQTLSKAAAEVEAAALEVAAAEAQLAAVRSLLRDRQDVLLQHAQRALAYARVYAETNAELSARLEAIALPRAARRPVEGVEDLAPARPRGRPRKQREPQPELELQAPAAE